MALAALATEARDQSVPVAPAATMVFRTYRDGRCRTVGALAQLGVRDEIDAWSEIRAKTFLESLPEIEVAEPVAQGKLALVKSHAVTPLAAVFQRASSGCGRVFCGNAAAAIAANIAAETNTRYPAFSLRGSGALTVTVRAVVKRTHIAQNWLVRALPEIRTASNGQQRAVEANLFNSYTVVDSLSGVDDLLQDTGPGRRIAVVSMDTAVPEVKFFTSGRPHPSAPLTGLCILALLSRRIDWLRPLAAAKHIIVNGLTEPLPGVAVWPGYIEFELPESEVVFEPVYAAMCAPERVA